MSSDANIPQILVDAITGQAVFPTEVGVTQVLWKNIGMLPISSGKIVACDPLAFAHPKPFDRTIEPGNYPVRLLMADFGDEERIAAAVLVLDDSEMPTQWRLATTHNQDLSELGPDQFYGHPVDSGTSGFLDLDAASALEAAMNEAPEYFESILKELNETYDHTRSWTIHHINGDTQQCVAAFSSGYGDGLYPSYWGMNAEGRTLWLLTEFEVL